MQSSHDAVLGNIDLLTEILLRLPTKQVARCNCVSKQWLALISSPRFRYSHTLRLCHTSPPFSLLLHRSYGLQRPIIVPLTNSDADPSPVTTLQFDHCFNLFRRSYMNIIQSCNGFLLFKTSFFVDLCTPQPLNYYVCNPTTNHFRRLQFPGEYFDFEYLISALYLAFEPLRSPHFKVISFRTVQQSDGSSSIRTDQTSGPEFEINVYSLETDSWSEDGVRFTASPNTPVDSGVYCNGAIHWYTPGEDSVYFDVHRQCFNPLPEPESLDYNNLRVKYFGESRGHLHLILTNSDESLEFDILELKEDYSGWVVKYRVDLNLVGDAFSRLADPSFSVLCVVHQVNEEDSMVVFFVDSKIMSYNLKDHSSRIIYEVDQVRTSFQYFETLLNVGLEPLRQL